ncbi:hypothetical protein MSZK_43980 [Mycobacterium sp. shizuoka-1]|nr:hypothetical protein MSZK_43980 [Mycobacterium sp. shizuoka-1]
MCDTNVAHMVSSEQRAVGTATGGNQRPVAGRWTGAFIALGAVFALVALVAIARWGLQGPHSVNPGPDEFGGVKLVILRVLEWGQFAAFLVLVGWFVVKPLVERRGLGFDGLFILVSFAMNIWDPLDNYFVFAFQYNAHFLNVGSWGGFIPGWQGPHPELWAVPLGFIFGCYTWSWYAAVRLGSFIYHRLVVARPAWAQWQRYGLVYLAVVVQSAISEIIFIRLEHWTYPTQNSFFVIGHGQYGWPWFNCIIYGMTWMVMVWLRESANQDNGQGLSFVERGIDRYQIGSLQKTTLRFLAIFGFVSAVYILIYFVPFNLIMMNGTPVTDLPSYFPVPWGGR